MEIVPILFLLIFVSIFGLALLLVTGVLGPKPKNSDVKKSPYESGVAGVDTNNSKISIKFYLTAILFILFDIEIIFMYPWAIAYKDFLISGHGLYMLSGMLVFLAIFIFGLFWEIKSRALDWE